MIKENKVTKYALYAIGEIVLVVIGILIALSINNWNENRKKALNEQFYLNELKIEFKNNLDALNHSMVKNEGNIKNALQLTNYILDSTLKVSDTLFNKLLFHSILGEIEYRPSPGVLNEIINSGKLELISNKTLRTKLSSWEGLIMRVRFQEKEHSIPRLKLADLVYANGNFRNGFLNTNYNSYNLKPSNNKINNIQLLKSQEFDNLLTSFYLTGKYLNESYYSDFKLEIEQTLALINQDIEND